MDKNMLIQRITQLPAKDPGNYVSEEAAIYPHLVGMQIYDTPLVAFSSAQDPIYTEEFKKPGVIHPDYKTPEEWLPGAKTVISFFLPFSKTVKESNRREVDKPFEDGIRPLCSAEWLHARVEGQIFLDHMTDVIQEILQQEGYHTFCPATSGDFRIIAPFVSNWSERHAAYVSGLGTFGLSKGLITEKGIAGRFGSVITDAEFEPTVRPYSSPFEYCTMCGACAKKCPAGAIDPERGCALGKDQRICGPYVDSSKLPPQGKLQRARYGCGKCQVGVPCESRIPRR